jgi:hypothetical protein
MKYATNKMLLSAVLAACAVGARADVTVTTTTAGRASVINVGGTSTSLIKGNRMRTDSVMGGRTDSLIVDIDGRRFVSVDDRKKSATVTPLASIADELEKVGIGAVQATLAKTSQVKRIAGYSCTVHDVSISMPFSPTGKMGEGMDLNMVLAGTVCLSTQAPGLADYQQFYRASADSGFIFGDPRAARSPTGAAQAKAYAALTRKMAEAGMALESHVTISATGDNPMASMMGKAAAGDITTTVTQIAVGDLPAERFDVPAGYKVKQK